MPQQQHTLVILLILILYVSTHVRALIPTENQSPQYHQRHQRHRHHQRHRRVWNTAASSAVDVKDDTRNVVVDTAAQWRTTPQQHRSQEECRDRTKCIDRSSWWTETESVQKCNTKKPCPDPTEQPNDWIQDRCEALFATIGTVWAYCSHMKYNNSSSITLSSFSNIGIIPTVVHHVVHEIITFVSMKIQNIVRSIFDDNNINCMNIIQNSISMIGI